MVEGKKPVDLALAAFDNYFDQEDTFEDTDSAKLTGLGLQNIDAKVAFSPHSAANESSSMTLDTVTQLPDDISLQVERLSHRHRCAVTALDGAFLRPEKGKERIAFVARYSHCILSPRGPSETLIKPLDLAGKE